MLVLVGGCEMYQGSCIFFLNHEWVRAMSLSMDHQAYKYLSSNNSEEVRTHTACYTGI